MSSIVVSNTAAIEPKHIRILGALECRSAHEPRNNDQNITGKVEIKVLNKLNSVTSDKILDLKSNSDSVLICSLSSEQYS